MSGEIKVLRNFASIMLLASLLGCDVQSFDDAAEDFNSGSASPPPSSNPPPSNPPPGTPPPAFGATLSEIQTNVFSPSCATAGCHAGAGAAGLNLEPGNSYAMLVGIASSQQPGILLVAPNNPDDSYLIQKLEGTAATGARMPTGTPLAQSEIDIVRQWITDGALDDSAATQKPIQVTVVTPGPNRVLDTSPSSIVVGFSREVDASTVNASTFMLVASGGDMVFGNGNDVHIAAALPPAVGGNPRSAVFDLTGIVLQDDLYRVRLSGTGPSVIMDLDANSLQGQTSNGRFGDFVAEFVVGTP